MEYSVMHHRKVIVVCLLLFVTYGLCQEGIKRPEFPDVFQTEVEGIFIKEKEIVELSGSLYYDKIRNRAAYQYTMAGESSRSIFDFDSNKAVSIDGYECAVVDIPDDPMESFFPFTVDKDKKTKTIVDPEIIFFFDKSEFDAEALSLIPSLVYKAHIDIPMYGIKNCDVTHIFSKQIELPNCKDSDACDPTLLSISVKCKDSDGKLIVDHTYNFFRFTSRIVDDSIFLPPPGVHCDVKDTKAFPRFNSYFSFSFDVVQKIKQTENESVFTTHQEVWYDADHSLLRIDQYTENGLLASSKVLDFVSRAAFVIVPTASKCYILSTPEHGDYGKSTGLPNFFFYADDSSAKNAVYVGQRTVHGLKYEVWSTTWIDHQSEARMVEEVYFLEIIPDQIIAEKLKETYLKVSHIDIYTYENNDESREYKLNMLGHITVNNYRTNPKVWSEFDIATCFNHRQRKDFYMKVNGKGITRESISYLEVLEHLYDKIVAATGVSVLRISEMTGEFDGTELIGLKGTIIENTKESGFRRTERGMNETFHIMKEAVSRGEFNVPFQIENKQPSLLIVLSVEDPTEKEIDVTVEGKRPEFPAVFQTEVEGIFIQKKEIVELSGSLYYDKIKNRAAYQYTMAGGTSRSIYDFQSNKVISINGNECVVDRIPDTPEASFFPFTVDKDRKIKTIVDPEIILFFDKSVFDADEQSLIPSLVYKARIDIPFYDRENCDVIHFFSKKIELPNCKDGDSCGPTLLSISVKCKDNVGKLVVDHTYNFFRFTSGIVDDSIFLPPPGVHCDVKDTKSFPRFNSYFSFSFDVVHKNQTGNESVFSTHQEVWYDADHSLLRIDGYSEKGLMASSRVLDFQSRAAFEIVPTDSQCFILPTPEQGDYGKSSGLPNFFFYANDSSARDAVYVGQRTVQGLKYEVWSTSSSDQQSNATMVEEVYFLEIIPDQTISEKLEETLLKVSHVDIYSYGSNDESMYKLNMFNHLTINNYRTNPKEWAAFDIATCFNHLQKKDFYMEVNGTGITRESISYLEVLEQLYNKIVAATGVAVLRISEMTGEFNGTELIGLKGTIIDNRNESGFRRTEPDMNETFYLMKEAASRGDFNVPFQIENNQPSHLIVLSVEDPTEEKETIVPAIQHSNDCYSGASLAAAGVVLLLVGISFGVAGYYVFLKKRRSSNHDSSLIRDVELTTN